MAHFVRTTDTLEIGHHHNYPITAFIRTIVEDNLVWESADDYPTFDAAWADLQVALGEWLRKWVRSPEISCLRARSRLQ